jgi:hypothetical protein
MKKKYPFIVIFLIAAFTLVIRVQYSAIYSNRWLRLMEDADNSNSLYINSRLSDEELQIRNIKVKNYLKENDSARKKIQNENIKLRFHIYIILTLLFLFFIYFVFMTLK